MNLSTIDMHNKRDNELLIETNLKKIFNKVMDHSEVSQLEETKKIVEWYNKEHINKKESIASVIIIMGTKLAEQIAKSYVKLLVRKLEIKTESREISLKDIEIGLFDTDIHPYVNFKKIVEEVPIHSIKFKFHLNMVTSIKKLTTKVVGKYMRFDIEKLRIELKLTLIGIEDDIMENSFPINSLTNPINIGKYKFEIKQIVLFSTDSNNKLTNERNVLKGNSYTENTIFTCSNCNSKNPLQSNFCYGCGRRLKV